MTNSTPTPADALIAALHEPGREQLLDLVQNPLRLTLLCMIWDGSSLPDTQAELYERYLRKIYEWNRNLHELEKYAERCGTTTTELKHTLNRQLGELAKAALNLPQERFRLSQALVEEHLGEESDQTSLGYLALRLGWLNRVGRDGRGDSIFAFYHATFQEYFAALAVKNWDYFLPRNHVDCPVAGKEYRIFEKQWKQVILCWLGRKDIEAEEKEAFIRALVEFKGGVRYFYGYQYQAYFLAAVGINQFKACSLATEIVRQVVKWGFGEFNTEKQEWRTFFDRLKEAARKVIPETIRPSAISALIEVIENCLDQWTRIEAAESLGKIDPGNPEAIADLLETIRTTEDKPTCKKVVKSLGKIGQGNPDVIASLLQVIRTNEDQLTCRYAAVNLVKIGQENPDAITGLLEIIRITEEDWTRLEAVNSLGKIGQGNPDAIAGLLEVIRTNEDEKIRLAAAYSLGKIDPKNSGQIAGLLEVIRTSENKKTRRRAAYILGEIGQGNPDAIAGLLEVIRTTEDEETQRQAAKSLGEIGQGNPDAIAGLLEVIRTTENEETRRRAAYNILGKIGQGNPDAIAGLLEVIRTTENEETRRRAAYILRKIGQGNPEVTAGLVKIIRTIKDTRNSKKEKIYNFFMSKQRYRKPSAGLLPVIRTTEDKRSSRKAAYSLDEIEQGNPEAIAGLLEIIRTTKNEKTRWWAAWSLEKIGVGNPEAIAGFVEIIRTTENEDTRWQAAWSLEKIGVGNPEAIAGFVEIIRATENEDTRRQAAESLGKIGQGNPDAIAGLLEVIRTTEDGWTRWEAAESLGEIGQGNPQAIAGLLQVIRTTENGFTRSRAAQSLDKILTTREQYAGVVTALKDCLSDEVYQNNFDRFETSYKLIWNCAENLPYPDFYQAWHNPPTTPHPEVEDNTPATPTPFTQQCNLALLPQILNQALQTHPVNHQPICIDGSRFSDPSNPALQIYTTLKKAGCPPSPDGKPRTIAELQAYCDDDLSDRQIALILYEEPTDPPPQGFDITVLNQLARFSHPPIAVILPQPLPECRLPQFLEQDPNLITTLLKWLHNLKT